MDDVLNNALSNLEHDNYERSHARGGQAMTAKTDLLPLPAEDYVDDEGLWEKRFGPYSPDQMEDYALANVLHHTAALQAENERLLKERHALAAALEAARADAERWRHARKLLTIDDIEGAQGAYEAFGRMVNEYECKRADAAIDQARGKESGNVR